MGMRIVYTLYTVYTLYSVYTVYSVYIVYSVYTGTVYSHCVCSIMYFQSRPIGSLDFWVNKKPGFLQTDPHTEPQNW